MIEIDAGVEYAVEVPGRGYVSSTFPTLVLADEPVCMHQYADADSSLGRIKEIYVKMGCADIAETVQLISRAITVTRGEWGLAGSEVSPGGMP